MNDLRTRFNGVQRLTEMWTVIFLIVGAGAITTAQQRPAIDFRRTTEADSANSTTNPAQHVVVNTDLVTLHVSVIWHGLLMTSGSESSADGPSWGEDTAASLLISETNRSNVT